MTKKLFGLVSLLCACLFFFSFSSTAYAEKTYQIGTDVTYPPFEFANKDNKYVGIDIDLLKAIAKEENFKVAIKPVGFNAAVQSLQSGQLDGVMAGMAMTDERKVKFDFSEPYYKTGFVMAVAKDSKITKLEQLRGKRVAIKTGTAAGEYAISLKDKYGFTTVTFDDSDNMYNDVVNGNSVACFEDIPVMQYAIKTGTALKIVTKPAQGGYYGFAVMKGQNQELLKKFNAGLAKIKKNGEYQKIVDRYLSSKTVAAQKGMQLRIELPDTALPPYVCDGERIAQVLSILLDNAMSYTPQGGHILLSLSKEGNRWMLRVQDNGPGIPQEARAQIFERFYRAEKSRKDKEHFGLGLCIAQEIVRLHRGRLYLDDTPGGGATFVVSLPANLTPGTYSQCIR